MLTCLFLSSFLLLTTCGTARGALIDITVQFKDRGITTRLGGASVKCFDEDFLNQDDSMAGPVSTNTNGFARLSYSKMSPSLFNPFGGWDTGVGTDPDIYCIVTKSKAYKLYTVTKDNVNQDNTANFGIVTMYPNRVARGDPGQKNGCGPASDWDDLNVVVDFLTGFGNACNNHDLCYNNCFETKQSCDLEFRDLMYSECNDSQDSNAGRAACKAAASTMYALVRDNSLGQERFDAGQVAYGCCPNDPNKNVAGQCGCGSSDTDSDGDGTADCNDLCAGDPGKTAPGVCGCGSPDTDSDGDGVADCNDQCDDDPNKTVSGECGCGTPDTDSDGDGTADCNDLCAGDPGKTAPGVCGCGSPDTDSDGDGVANCNDQCDDDPNKTVPGECGCGSPDTDSDGDGTADCNDLCAGDPGKTAPGVCGCGSPDTDSDGDGVANCNDQCDDDPNKTVPGECGCGSPDTDSDGDGVADCIDQCGDDPGKIVPGECGCGSAETGDRDGDGVADCKDRCPGDAAKVEPGKCGCGVSDEDKNGDDIPDCLEDDEEQQCGRFFSRTCLKG